MSIACQATLLVAVVLVSTQTVVADVLNFEPLRATLDIGIAASDAPRNAFKAGPGKLRYGKDPDDVQVEPVLSEAHLIAAASFGQAWRGLLDIKFDDEQRHALDIAEAYLGWRSAPRAHRLRVRIKGGTFLPPFSLENRAIGWSSPLTLSSSALNAWIGEELRINGAELRLLYERGDWRYSAAGASYFANDAAGTLIAFRGFAVHDRELGLLDRTRIAHSQHINPRGPFRGQSRYYEPLHEIDGRPGFYAGATASNRDGHRFEFYYYDNNADAQAFKRTAGQYAWHTRFWVAGFQTRLPWAVQFMSQAMRGDTGTRGQLSADQPDGMQMDYFAGYGLISRAFGGVQTTLRGEYFEVRDDDDMRDIYDNAESGHAVTFAATRSFGRHFKLFLETQYIDHERPVRAFAALPRRIDEWLLRLNLRIFL